MKLILICYGASLHRDLLDALARANIQSYTLWPQVHGVGQAGGPRLDSAVWPGYNSVMAVVLEEAQKDALMSEIRVLRERHRREGLKAFVLHVEEVT